MEQWIPILVMFFVALGFALASLGVSYLLSPKNPTIEKLMPYECGISPEHEPSQRFPVKFYMVAMLYIIFDIEIIFLLLWATRFYQLGWYGILVVGIFTLSIFSIISRYSFFIFFLKRSKIFVFLSFLLFLLSSLC